MVEFAMSFLLYISRSKFPGVRKVTKDEWYKQLFENLGKSTFRSRFHLKQVDIDYINSKGLDKIEETCARFYRKARSTGSDPKRWKTDPNARSSCIHRTARNSDMLPWLH